MGGVPEAKAGVESAVNDATRLLGGTLGVTVLGSTYATLFSQPIATPFILLGQEHLCLRVDDLECHECHTGTPCRPLGTLSRTWADPNR
jgi:hypothetical protein